MDVTPSFSQEKGEVYRLKDAMDERVVDGGKEYLLTFHIEAWFPEENVANPELLSKIKRILKDNQKKSANEAKPPEPEPRMDEGEDTEDSDSDDSEEDEEKEWVVENILGKRIVRGKAYYLLKWKGWSADFNSWEPVEHLTSSQKLVAQFEVEHKKRQEKLARERQKRSLDRKRRSLEMKRLELEMEEKKLKLKEESGLAMASTPKRRLWAVAGAPVRKQTKRTPPNAKEPISDFVLFCRDMRPIIHRLNPEYTSARLDQVLKNRWERADRETKRRYDLLAQQERKKKEKNAPAPLKEELDSSSEDDEDANLFEPIVKPSKTTPVKRRVQEDGNLSTPPTTPTTGFALFYRDARPKLQEKHPEYSPCQLTLEIGKDWEKLDSDSKLRYKLIAQQQEQMKRFDRECEKRKMAKTDKGNNEEVTSD